MELVEKDNQKEKQLALSGSNCCANNTRQIPIIFNVKGKVQKMSKSFLWISLLEDVDGIFGDDGPEQYSVMARDVIFSSGVTYEDLQESPFIEGETEVRMNMVQVDGEKSILTVWEPGFPKPQKKDEEIKANSYYGQLNKNIEVRQLVLGSDPLSTASGTTADQMSAKSVPTENVDRYLILTGVQ